MTLFGAQLQWISLTYIGKHQSCLSSGLNLLVPRQLDVDRRNGVKNIVIRFVIKCVDEPCTFFQDRRLINEIKVQLVDLAVHLLIFCSLIGRNRMVKYIQ